MQLLLAQAANPFQGLEDSLYQTIIQVQGAWFTAPWYATWIFILGIFTAFFFLYAVVFKSFYLYLSNKPGLIREVMFQYVRGLVIVICTINVHVFVDFLFALFRLFIDFGNQLLSGTTSTAIDITQLINDTASAIQSQTFDPLSIIYGLSWFTLMFGVVFMGVIYVINLGESIFYLFVVFPFLCRAGVMGLLLPQTSSWFSAITNLALEQLLKPLLGKVFFWLTLVMLQIGFSQITDTTNGIQSLLSQIAWLLFIICFGVIMQLRTPGLAKLLALAARGAAGSILQSGLGGALLSVGAVGVGALARGIGSLRPASTSRVTSARSLSPGTPSYLGNALGQTRLAQEITRTRTNLASSFNQRVSTPFARGITRTVDLVNASGLTPLIRELGDAFRPVERPLNIFTPGKRP